jgi:hypothetical protein
VAREACDYLGLRICEGRREINRPNGATPWTPQKPPLAVDHEDFHGRAAAVGTRHGNQLGMVDQGLPRRLGKSNLPGGGDRAGCVTRSGVEHDVPASIGTPAPRETTEHRQCQCPGCAEARKPGKRGDDSSTEPATLILVSHRLSGNGRGCRPLVMSRRRSRGGASRVGAGSTPRRRIPAVDDARPSRFRAEARADARTSAQWQDELTKPRQRLANLTIKPPDRTQ